MCVNFSSLDTITHYARIADSRIPDPQVIKESSPPNPSQAYSVPPPPFLKPIRIGAARMLRRQMTWRRSTRCAILLVSLRRPVRWHASLVRRGLGPLRRRLVHGRTTGRVIHGRWWWHVGLHIVVFRTVGVVLGWLGIGVARIDAGELRAGNEPLLRWEGRLVFRNSFGELEERGFGFC